jgi:catechol 2,3-dioxygenase-like lactoylglutathione lyase family enzyme
MEDSFMAQLSGPDFITLLVREIEPSRRFYSEVLGFKTSPENRPNAVAFLGQPISFAIRKSSVDLNAGAQPGQGIMLWFRADDAAALHEQLKSLGVPITQSLADSPFGKTFTIRDPDGYLITVHDGG